MTSQEPRRRSLSEACDVWTLHPIIHFCFCFFFLLMWSGDRASHATIAPAAQRTDTIISTGMRARGMKRKEVLVTSTPGGALSISGLRNWSRRTVFWGGGGINNFWRCCWSPFTTCHSMTVSGTRSRGVGYCFLALPTTRVWPVCLVSLSGRCFKCARSRSGLQVLGGFRGMRNCRFGGCIFFFDASLPNWAIYM